MIEFVPAILTDRAGVFKEQAERLVTAGVRRAHLDIGDGVFVPTTTIDGVSELMALDLPLDWDVHLMVRRPEEYLARWWQVPRADRFIVHVEATDQFDVLATQAHDRGRRIGAAINPETPLERLYAVLNAADLAQFMTVVPGAQGGEFLPWVLERLAQTHAEYPQMELAVDGGITPQTAPACAAAGAHLLVCGSYIAKAPDVVRALQELEDSVK